MTSTQSSLSDDNVTVERIIGDAFEIRIQHGPEQCKGTLKKSDIVALARKLDVNADDLNADEEEVVVDVIRFYAVSVMCCLVFSGLFGIFSN